MKSVYMNKQFWIGLMDRAIASLAQSTLAVLTTGVTGLLDIDFKNLASIVGLMTVLSIATSFATPNRVIGAEDGGETAKLFQEFLDEVGYDGSSGNSDIGKHVRTNTTARHARKSEDKSFKL